jgi:hypothetical protein
LPYRIVLLSPDFWEDQWVKGHKCPIGFETHDSEGKGIIIIFYLTEVEKATFRAREEVLGPLLPRIDRHAMSRSTSPPGDDEEFAVPLKPFVRMAVATQEQASLLELKKRIGKADLNLLAWMDHPTVGERRLVTADNDEINLCVLLEYFKFTQIPSILFPDLFFG